MSETVTKVNGIPLDDEVARLLDDNPKMFDDELMCRLHRDVEVIPQEIVVAIKTKGEKDEE